MTTPAPLERLNRARVKDRKPPLLEHEVGDVDRRLGEQLRRAGATQAEIAAHLVSGHFKRRATGVFWWRPFIRGLGGDAA
jgi:hypothetical protein